MPTLTNQIMENDKDGSKNPLALQTPNALPLELPAGEADEFRGLTLLNTNRDEEAYQYFEKAAKEGRPVAQFFATILHQDSTLEEFLEDVDKILAAFLELFPSIQNIPLHVKHIARKLGNLSKYQESDCQQPTATQPTTTRPQEDQTHLHQQILSYFDQKTPADKIAAIKSLLATFETFSS